MSTLSRSDFLSPETIGAIFVLIAMIYLLGNRFFARRLDVARLIRERYRRITAYEQLNRAVMQAIETGEQIHCSLGSGGLFGPKGIPALVGAGILRSITRSLVHGDRPPLATSGDGTVAILAGDGQKDAYSIAEIPANYSPVTNQLVGLTAWSYAVGTASFMYDEEKSMNILIGHFDSEIGLLAEANERSPAALVGGSDSLVGQSLLYASAQNPIIAEELYVAGAYVRPDRWQWAGLRSQDFIRWVLIGLILCGLLFKLIGLL